MLSTASPISAIPGFDRSNPQPPPTPQLGRAGSLTAFSMTFFTALQILQNIMLPYPTDRSLPRRKYMQAGRTPQALLSLDSWHVKPTEEH